MSILHLMGRPSRVSLDYSYRSRPGVRRFVIDGKQYCVVRYWLSPVADMSSEPEIGKSRKTIRYAQASRQTSIAATKRSSAVVLFVLDVSPTFVRRRHHQHSVILCR